MPLHTVPQTNTLVTVRYLVTPGRPASLYHFVSYPPSVRGKTTSRGSARRACPALKFSKFYRGGGDLLRATGQYLPVPRYVKDAAPMDGGVAHLSLWKPKRATNWVIPRFEPGKSQISTRTSHHPSLSRHIPELRPDRTVRNDAALTSLHAALLGAFESHHPQVKIRPHRGRGKLGSPGSPGRRLRKRRRA